MQQLYNRMHYGKITQTHHCQLTEYQYHPQLLRQRITHFPAALNLLFPLHRRANPSRANIAPEPSRGRYEPPIVVWGEVNSCHSCRSL